MSELNGKIAPHKSSLGNMDANVLALLVYLAPIVLSLIPVVRYIAWAAPLVVFLIEKDSSFVRFHAMQALLLNVVGSVLSFILMVLIAGSITFVAGGYGGGFVIISILSWLIVIAIIVLAILAMVKAYGYQQFKIPLIGSLSEKWSPINSQKQK